jgi:L-iditol 2-dehydrogenase
MKAVRLTGAGRLETSDEPMPVASDGEVLIRVTAVGVCGSDLHWFAESGIGDARLEKPLVLGHEFAGEIASGPRKGQLVAVDPAIVCGHCEHCRDGNPNFCENGRFAGHGTHDGALREYLAWPEACLFPVPSHFSAADAAMLEPLGVAIHSVDLGKIRVGASVGVFGCGPIGLLILAVARAAGAGTIVATDRLPHRVEMARAYGATVAVLADGQSERAAAHEATGGRGLDVAFEAAGDDDAVETAIDTVRSGARVVLAGIPSNDETHFVASTARRKGLTLKLVRRMKHVYPRAIELVDRGVVDVRSLVTHHFPLERTAEAFGVAARREGGKVVVES